MALSDFENRGKKIIAQLRIRGIAETSVLSKGVRAIREFLTEKLFLVTDAIKSAL